MSSLSILPSEMLYGFSMRIIIVVSFSDHPLSSLLPFKFPQQFGFFLLPLFPLFVCDSSHNSLVCFSLLFSLFHFSFLLIFVALFNMLVSLLEQALFKPILEDFVCSLLLNLLAQAFLFLFMILFHSLHFLLLALCFLPCHYFHLLFLSADVFFSLIASNLLQDVFLCLTNQLFLQLLLMLLTTHPFFMSDSVGRLVADLTSLNALSAWIVQSSILDA